MTEHVPRVVTPPDTDRAMRATYLRVLIVEVIVLGALWILQQHFSV